MKLISDVLFIPKLEQNLLSVAQLINKGNSVVFQRNLCIIFDSHGYKIAEARMENNSFVLNLKSNVFCTRSDMVANQDRTVEEKKRLEKIDSADAGKKIEHCNAAICDLISNVKSPKSDVWSKSIKEELKMSKSSSMPFVCDENVSKVKVEKLIIPSRANQII